MIEIQIKLNDENQTLISFLKKITDYKEQKINLYKLLRTKKIKINNKVVKDPKYKLVFKDTILIYFNINIKTQRDTIHETKIKLEVPYEDENLLVVNKNFNLLVHNNYGESLDNAVKNYLINNNQYDPETSQSFVISHINRLDKLSTGLVIYAKNKKTLNYFLSKIDKSEFIHKFYLLKCEGTINWKSKKISGYISKDIENQKMIFTNNKIRGSKTSITEFKLIKTLDNLSVLEAKLITGRKNQIRATMEFLKHPIMNDYKYGAARINDKNWINLFAYKLIFKNLDSEYEYLNDKEIIIPVKFK